MNFMPNFKARSRMETAWKDIYKHGVRVYIIKRMEQIARKFYGTESVQVFRDRGVRSLQKENIWYGSRRTKAT